ncbi:probable G-protein coupled receptor B0563.6 [Bactrocera neohumeralis]|uniref:probable G-protein coupled receptor B0563.6 n=1 Tax=Bactrocera tryoni TaxID=59916 RepID=UPI001A9872D3|nr:probable G-protein coupled receptor B0563.6 [Bactrocera tryoni]XP_039961737.1 probable G-protein coupled receptor B0563.6 [Bactrocera tryoni]XP_050330958.1 probable G-protein coupled receptor B0563.6 [Bactrocera neohumeralis]XP_050330960.1 probable G-protein coupled receptor B0563.6 [Bactrocera neohumeralis]XP_050330961.1 probable G-protein coupled receptor B0563.6 [Bactrocera neohumeralis]XP_050330962.1 probable G-protein coupled receptor B0563.6 [Bactrocera neohumeralis]
MITRLYNTEEDQALCSLIWGRNLTASIANEQIDEDGETTLVGNVAGATPTLYSAHSSYGAGVGGGSSSGGAESDILIGSATVNGAGGSSLRDDFFIANDFPEDPRTEALREYSYGIILPIICSLGIIGNVLNLVVLTRRNMRGTAYIYMRAYSTAALLAIVFAIPFGMRMLVHKDRGRWEEFGPAFYTAHLELFLGNGCLGVGVMMLLVLTIERYVSVCHPGFSRPVMGPPGIVVFLTTLVTFIIYTPSVFRGVLVKCILHSDGNYVYFRRDNNEFLKTLFYSVYKVMLEVIFKLIPTVLIAGLNMRIMLVYRKTCQRRREMLISRSNCVRDEDPRKFAEERRLFLLLGSTSILFLVCVSPMAIVHMTIASEVLPNFSFQVFRALANLMELTNYSITFYIYCLFSEDFRNTLIRTIKWPWVRTKLCHHVDEISNARATPLMHFNKIALRNHHITTTSGVCTGMGRSSSI